MFIAENISDSEGGGVCLTLKTKFFIDAGSNVAASSNISKMMGYSTRAVRKAPPPPRLADFVYSENWMLAWTSIRKLNK